VRYSRRAPAEICHLLPAPLPEAVLVIHVITKKSHNILISLVADAVAFERVSALEFPANREIIREFLEF